jgi:two-component system sensor histidine kinase UhpB
MPEWQHVVDQSSNLGLVLRDCTVSIHKVYVYFVIWNMKRFGFLLVLFLSLHFFHADGQSAVNDSLLNIVRAGNQDLAEIMALNELAANYARTDMGKAKTCLYQSIRLARALSSLPQLDNAYAQMVTDQLNTGHADSARYFLVLMEKMAKEKTYGGANANYNFSAGLFYKIQGNFKAALPYMMESLSQDVELVKTNPSVPNRVTLAGQNLNIGNNYSSLGQYREALQYHLKALDIFEETSTKRGVSFCYQSIGGDFLQLGQFRQARSYTERSIALKNELKDQRGIATGLEQLGSVCEGLKQYDSALSYFNASLKICRDMKLTAEEANVLTGMGQVYTYKNDPVNAKRYYQNSKLAALRIGDSSRAAAADAALIGLQTTINKQQRVETNLMSSLHTSIESGDKGSELLNYQYLADHYASIGQYDKALAYTHKLIHVRDSLQSMDVQLQMKKIEEQYNVEKKEQEIALLKKDQQLSHLSLQKQEAFQIGAGLGFVFLVLIGFLIINRSRVVHNARRVIEMEKMRNRIARDLHDDIGSTITSINVLSNVALQPEEKEERLMRSNLQKIKERSSAIMESMDDIVWAINPQNDTMEQLLFRMKEFSAEILEPLAIAFAFEEKGDFASTKLDIKKRKDVYLLFKEAVNNAAKYSQCRNLHVRLNQNHQFLQMEITDDGKGFVEKEIRTGNGLNNMRERAASMGGRLLIEPVVGIGTRIVLDVAVSSHS